MAYRVLSSLLLTASLLSTAWAAEWTPTKEIEFVIPFGPGGGADLLARTLIRAIETDKLVPTAIAPVNKGGGGTAVGVGYVKGAKAGDPHTLVLINPQTQLTPLQVQGAAGWRDLTPVTNIMVDDYLFITGTSSPYNDAADLVVKAKAQPAESVSIGSAGTADDLAIALFEQGTGIDFNVVRFTSGAEALTAVLGGHVDVAAGNPLEFLSQIEGGAVRPLGLFRETRHEALPQVPTLAEQGLVVQPFQMWRGIALPKDVPAEAVSYWQDVFVKAANSPGVVSFLDKNLGTLNVVGGEDFNHFLEERETAYKALLQPSK